MSTYEVNDSIAAIASPPGPACRGVIRLSGPRIDEALVRCFQLQIETPDESVEETLSKQKRSAVLGGAIKVDEPINRVATDLYYWPDSASYTRQRSAELHCTGSVPVLNEVMRTLAANGVRQALPGEFTLRAFLAGRIDLTRAEAVLGVIDSQSDQEMDTALKQLAGGLSGPIEDLQDRLLEVLAHLEAGLDFVEEDIEFISNSAVQESIDEASELLNRILNQIDHRAVNQHRLRVVLSGRPNAGKSRLQNALSDGGKAIVSEVAGTTRDYLICPAAIDGLEFDLIDTAGMMKESGQQVSSVQQRAEEQTGEIVSLADLQIICIDGNKSPDEWELARINELADCSDGRILVQTKSDLESCWGSPQAIRVSSETGDGLGVLLETMHRRLTQQGVRNRVSGGEVVSSTSNRCFESLRGARDELDLASEYCRGQHGDEIIAASLRVVLDELAVVTGKIFTDDILDRVFSRFCIGK